jgi:hypothetical protein
MPENSALGPAHRALLTRLDRRNTKNRGRGAPQAQADPVRASRNWSPGQALIEVDLR